MRLLRPVLGTVALLSGAALIAVPLAWHGSSASRDADRLLQLFRPALSDRGLAQMRADLSQGETTARALVTAGMPVLARDYGEPLGTYEARLPARYPALRTAFAAGPRIALLANGIISNLENRQDQFRSADRLPGFGLNNHQAFWATIGLGAALIMLGLALLVGWAGGAVSALLLLVGVALIVLPLVGHYPSRTSDTAKLLDALKPYGAAKTAPRVAALQTVRAGLDELRQHTIPDAADRAHISPDALSRQLAEASPPLAAGLPQIDAIVDRFAALIDASVRSQPLLKSADRFPTDRIMWLYLGPGIALTVATAASVRPNRRRG